MSSLEILSEPVWQRLTWTLLHFFWQGLALAVLLAAVLWLFRVRQARTRYVLGLLTMLALAACPVVTFAVLEVHGGLGAGVGWGAAERSPTMVRTEVGLRPTLPPPAIVRPLHEPASSPGDRVPLPDVAGAAAKRQPIDSERARAWNLPPANYVRPVQPYLLVGWIAGVFLLSVRLLLAQAGVHWMGRGRRPISVDLLSCVSRLGGRLGLRAVPRVFTSERIREAIVVGLLRPIVLLPACWLAEMSPEVLEAVLAHELAHIRRWDLWVNLFQRLVETLLFYHPAVWWLSRRIRLEREMCCDELAVAATGQRATYATVLELVGRRQLALPRPELGAAMGGDRMALLNRVRNVLGIAPSRESVRLWPAGLLAVFVLLAIWLNSTGVAQPEPGKTRAAREEEQPAASPSVSAEEVMRRYREAVWAEVLPKLDQIEHGKATEIIERVASEATAKHIMPHRDMLARHFLDQLPEADPIDRSQWTVREIKLPDELEQDLDSGSMPQGRFLLWNPVEAAQAWRSAFLARTMTPANYGKRTFLQMQTPTRSVALDSDLAHPVIAMATGDELYVVGLRRTEEGLYIRDKFEWLRKKPGATQDYCILAADASPAQKLLQAFGDAVWAELAPKLKTMETEDLQKEIGKLAGKHLAPHKDVLAAEAGRILKELPKSKPIDRPQWRPKLPDFTAKDLEDLQGAMRTEALKDEHVALAFGAWHPVRMAAMMRMSIMLQLTGSEALGIRSMIERIASRPVNTVADANPDHPLIVSEAGNELMIVGLKRNRQGCYELERFEWLTRSRPGKGQGRLAAPPAKHPDKSRKKSATIGIYLITGRPKGVPFEKIPLKDFVLADKPLIGEADIFSYDWESHTIRLKSQAAADRILKRKGVGYSFVVVVNGEPLYRGRAISIATSLVPRAPVIHMGPGAGQWQPQMAIRMHPPPITGTPDPRSDPRLKQALKALNMLTGDKSDAGNVEKPESSNNRVNDQPTAELKKLGAGLERDEHRRWSPVNEGLRFRWVPSGSPVVVGTRPTLTFEVENASEKPLLWEVASEISLGFHHGGFDRGSTHPKFRVAAGPKTRPATAREVRERFGVGRPDRRGDDPMEGYYRFEPAGRLKIISELPGTLERAGEHKVWVSIARHSLTGSNERGQKGVMKCPPFVLQAVAKAPETGIKWQAERDGIEFGLKLVGADTSYRIGQKVGFAICARNPGRAAREVEILEVNEVGWMNRIEGNVIDLCLGLSVNGTVNVRQILLAPGQTVPVHTAWFLLVPPDFAGDTQFLATLPIKPGKYRVRYGPYIIGRVGPPGVSPEKVMPRPATVKSGTAAELPEAKLALEVAPPTDEQLQQLRAKYPPRAEAPSGEASRGIQLRLRALSETLEVGQLPRLTLDIRNQAAGVFALSNPPHFTEIEVDAAASASGQVDAPAARSIHGRVLGRLIPSA